MLSGETTNTNCKVFGLTRTGLEPTIYRTQGEHANHYTTDAVELRKSKITIGFRQADRWMGGQTDRLTKR